MCRLNGLPTDLTRENGRIVSQAQKAKALQPQQSKESNPEEQHQLEDHEHSEAQKDEISEKISEIFDSFELREADFNKAPVLRNFEAHLW